MAIRLWGSGRRARGAPALPSDIDALARLVEGVDRDRYLDVQAEDAWLAAAKRWPLVAAVLDLRVEDGQAPD
ncbi:MAG TPA: BcsR/BcsP family cellulose biosynthesis protein [Paraburkholderia sp.]|uniref:BcsR/BcsP family cellulose biosynthesis protein n=1 Tax=Paraburkholderia sp. TaxID=1926495 RepID=UPI002B54F081|nr:BcsR/BcsP family cellulose biosynthesis protein [Paraburkholderia sp.]HTR11303.1 BcsR/BcsP family cellulose biosynthesis protein [Paraburkholderia sp.]